MTIHSSLGEHEIKNRFAYHKPSPEIARQHEVFRSIMVDIGVIFDCRLPNGRAKSLAFTALEEAGMWAHKAIAEQSPIEEPPTLFEEDLVVEKDLFHEGEAPTTAI